jgi:hypothetical protein
MTMPEPVIYLISIPSAVLTAEQLCKTLVGGSRRFIAFFVNYTSPVLLFLLSLAIVPTTSTRRNERRYRPLLSLDFHPSCKAPWFSSPLNSHADASVLLAVTLPLRTPTPAALAL